MQRHTWVYSLTTPLSDSAAAKLQHDLDLIAESWKSHGKPLKGMIEIKYQRFVIARALPEFGLPSGCSIDSLRHALDETFARNGLSWFDPSEVFYKDSEGNLAHADFRALPGLIAQGTVHANTVVFDHTMNQSDDLNLWERPLHQTWLKRYLPSDVTAIPS
jgi:hypothetical protein